ncbi:hypothetical protein ABK040_013754 [Willaertia magna]
MPCFGDHMPRRSSRRTSDPVRNAKDRTNKIILRELNFWNNVKLNDINIAYKNSMDYTYYSCLDQFTFYSFRQRTKTSKKSIELENKKSIDNASELENNNGNDSCQLNNELAKTEEEYELKYYQRDYHKLKERTIINYEKDYNVFNLNIKKVIDIYPNNYEDIIKGNLKDLLRYKSYLAPSESNTSLKEQYNGDFSKLKNDLQLLVCVFEYLNSFDLMINVANVCKEWNEIIFFKEENKYYEDYHLQLFINRIQSVMTMITNNIGFKQFNFENILELQKRYEIYNLADLFLYSGMFHLEYFYYTLLNDYNKFNNETKFYIQLNCNPSHFLKDYKISNNRKFKTLMITNDTDFHYKTIDNNYILLIDYDNFDQLNSFLSKFILGYILYEKKQYKCSISFFEGIPLYLKFLERITKQIEMLELNENICFYYLLKMKEKANYFLNHIFPPYILDCFVTDDVLLGLHLILLDYTYQSENNHDDMVGINFTRLLQNIELVDQNDTLQDKVKYTTNLFPETMQVDYLQLFINDLKNKTLTLQNQEQDNISPFLIPQNAVDFLQEHIIDLSKVYLQNNNNHNETTTTTTNNKENNNSMRGWIETLVPKYKCFLSAKKKQLIPSKDIDLLFHFHLLHPLHYFQDASKLHYFNFQQKP